MSPGFLSFDRVVELSTLALAAAAAIATIWQGALTREALDQSRYSNLQVQQIAECSEFMFRADEFRSISQSWLAASLGDPPFVADGERFVRDFKADVIEKGGEVFRVATRLEFYADKGTRSDIGSATSAVTAVYVIADAPTVPDRASFVAWIDQLKGAVSSVREACERVAGIDEARRI